MLVEDVTAPQHVLSFFEKLERDRYETQELLSFSSTNWLLSAEDIKVLFMVLFVIGIVYVIFGIVFGWYCFWYFFLKLLLFFYEPRNKLKRSNTICLWYCL